ncbi:MAG: type I phosphomannose isomerase catalytic subunit [Phycisphaerae bacterium]
MSVYPFRFEPIYKKTIWGGRNLARLFGRRLPRGAIGESWELADLPGSVSRVANGPRAGSGVGGLMRRFGGDLLGDAKPTPDGRFPLLLKFLDANDTLSLQVHPDAAAVRRISRDGGAAAMKTECWYIVESRGGFIYKGVRPRVSRRAFRAAVESDSVEGLVRRIDVAAGDFHYIPAGVVHALGAGVVLAEVQTPSDTTYRVTDWGRGREIHTDLAMQCIRLGLTGDRCPGRRAGRLLATDYFSVWRRNLGAGQSRYLPKGRCLAIMIIAGRGAASHEGDAPREVSFKAGDTLLVPAAMRRPAIVAKSNCTWLEIGLPER